jgi:hypothetical protein
MGLKIECNGYKNMPKASLCMPFIPDYCYTLLKVQESLEYSVSCTIVTENRHEADPSLFQITYASYDACRPDLIHGFSSDSPCTIHDEHGRLFGTCDTSLNLAEPLRLSGMQWPKLFARFNHSLEMNDTHVITVRCSVDRKYR